jgi:hypothetical protein
LRQLNIGDDMALAPADYDFLSNFSTVSAIVLGSVLATLGGLASTQIERHFDKQQRERHAALFFGEVLSTLAILLVIARRVKGIGDPYGPITTRMLRQAQREIGMYDRNRENLYAIRDAALRARIHTHVLRVSMPIDGIFDTTEEMAAAQSILRAPQCSAEERAEITSRLERLTAQRDSAFEAVEEGIGQIEELVKDLEPVAHHSFEDIRLAASRAPRAAAQPASG